MPGTTYYFRAWSWREGDVWAPTYADDVATTQAVIPTGEEERPGVIKEPEEPSTWFQEPSGNKLKDLPGYDYIMDAVEALEMPEGSFWLVAALVITVCAGVLSFVVVHSSFVAIIAGGLAITACSVLGMAPLWFILIYALFGGGVIFVARRI